MSILDTLSKTLLSSSAIKTISGNTDANENQIQQVVSIGLPILLQALNSNAKDTKGAATLSKALDEHAQKDTKKVEEADTEDGSKIVKHILGSKTKDVEATISKKTGLKGSQVIAILAACAPILMAILGKKKKETNTSSDRLSDMISSLLGSSTKSSSGLDLSSIASSILKDSDGDGSSDVLNALGKLFK